MFERYTFKARMVIFYARYEASQFGSPQIETDHLLLGLLREDAELVRRIVAEDQTADSIRASIEERMPRGAITPTSVDLRLSSESKHVLMAARDESSRLKHDFIGTEHLLVGLLNQDSDPAARLLVESGARLEAAQKIVRETAADDLRHRGTERNPVSEEFLKSLF